MPVQCRPVLSFQPLPLPSGLLVPPGPKSLVCFLLASFYTGSGICSLGFVKPRVTHLPAYNLPNCIAISHCHFSSLWHLIYLKFFYFQWRGDTGKLPREMPTLNSPGNHFLLEFLLVCSGFYNNIINWVDYKQHLFFIGRLGSLRSWC